MCIEWTEEWSIIITENDKRVSSFLQYILSNNSLIAGTHSLKAHGEGNFKRKLEVNVEDVHASKVPKREELLCQIPIQLIW